MEVFDYSPVLKQRNKGEQNRFTLKLAPPKNV